MMNRTKIVLFYLCLLFTTSTSFGDGSGQTKNHSEERRENDENEHLENSKQTKCQENDEKDCDIDYINSNETGPLDSHEAMNTRELKARNKRSTEVDKKAFRNMLLGLVHKKSQDMKVDDDHTQQLEEEPPQKFQSDASELLLELMVRIAAHPQQWDQVHELLQRIDTDIVTSKKILSNLQKDVISTTSTSTSTSTSTTTESSTATTQIDEVQKLIILLDNEQQFETKKKNNESNKIWPNLDGDTVNNSEEVFDDDTIQKTKTTTTTTTTTHNIYPWNSNNKSVKNLTQQQQQQQREREREREFEFAYHRVTGLPLPYRSNYDKTRARNAYIAVSVIAPKSRDLRLHKQDNLLEDELRQLKPWSHEENLSKMENIRKKWFIRSDNQTNNNK